MSPKTFPGEVAKKLGCSWKEASDLIEDAVKILGVDNDVTNEEEIMRKVEELFEDRKPTAEELEARRIEKKKKKEEELAMERKLDRARQLKKDDDFKYCMLSCCTCGFLCMCNAFFGCWKKKPLEEYAEQL